MKMSRGYQIYIKGFKKDGSGELSKRFRNGGILNWFPTEQEAQARKKELKNTWGKNGIQYKVVFLGNKK